MESALTRLLRRLVELAEEDPGLHALLRESAELVLARLNASDAARAEGPVARADEAAETDQADTARREEVASDAGGMPDAVRLPDAVGTPDAVRLPDAVRTPDADPAELETTAPTSEGEADESMEQRLQRVLDAREAERNQLRRSGPADVSAGMDEKGRATPPPVVVEFEEHSDDAQGRLLIHWAADASLKAEAARWVGERQRRLARGLEFATEIAPGDRAMLDKAQTSNVYLWMCRRDAPVPADPNDWDLLAGNFDALADALSLNAMIVEQDALSDSLNQAMALLAEAQSALRLAVDDIDGRHDETQRETFLWLKRMTDRLRIYLPRFMRLNDTADPDDWGSLREQCAQLEDTLRAQLASQRQQSRQWGRLRYHLQRIRSLGKEPDIEDWTKALDAVDRLIEDGIAPSSVDLRDALLPFIDEIPDEVETGKNVLLALREIDRYLASREAEILGTELVESGKEELSAEERGVRTLLAGKSLVLIGGIQRPQHKDRIERAFGLAELIWLDGGAASYTEFEPSISRADVAVVILLIRWSSHGYGEVKGYCDAYDKPLIRVPAGYSPKQLAHQILEQAATRLHGEASVDQTASN